MPSASAKLEKQMSTDTNDPVKQVVTIVEKKVRNLEKRKGKLDAYRLDSQNGKELNEDQKKAVEKYDQVIELLEFTKDLQKQFNTVIQDAQKQHKREKKREQVERQQQELLRIKEIMVYQDLLNSMGGEDVRQDFLNGSKGAVKLTEAELTSLDDLYKAMCPEREADSFEVVAEAVEAVDFDALLATAAEHLQSLLDAKNKEAFGTTYKGLRDTLQKIHSCSYFSKSPVEVLHEAESIDSAEEKEVTEGGSSSEQDVQYTQPETNASPEVEDFVMVQKNASQVERPFYPAESSSLYSEPQQPPSHPIEVLSAQTNNLNFLQESQIELETSRVEPQPPSSLGASYPSAPYASAQSISALAQQRIRRTSEEANAMPHVPMATIPATKPTSEYNAIPSQTFTNQSFSTAIHHPIMAQGYVMQPMAARGGVQSTVAMAAEASNIYSMCMKMNLNSEVSLPSDVSSQYSISDMQDSSLPKHCTSHYNNGSESLADNRSKVANSAYSRGTGQLDYSGMAYQMANNSQVYMNQDSYGDNSSYSSNLKRGLPSRGGTRGAGAPRGTSNARGGRVGYRN